MSSVQPITLDEQEHYLATRQVTRGATHTPKRLKAKKASPPAVSRTLATFGTPENLPGFLHQVGSTVHTTNGSTAWTVVAQAETPAGTSPRSYRCVAGRMERVFGENALRPAEEHKTLTVIDVALNKATGQIEPVSAPGKGVRSAIAPIATQLAKAELKSMLTASVSPTLAPSIDEPALHTVEPMASRFTQTTDWTKVGGKPTKVPNSSSSPAPKIRLNAPFAPTAVVTVLVDCPKTRGKKNYDRWIAGYRTGRTVAETIAAGCTMGDLVYDQAHGFIKVA